MQTREAPPQSQAQTWKWPDKPWKRIHADLAGPFLGSMFLVVIDAHAKWPEVFELETTTSGKLIGIFRQLFAQFGLPEQLVTDNGPQFRSQEFAEFMTALGIVFQHPIIQPQTARMKTL